MRRSGAALVLMGLLWVHGTAALAQDFLGRPIFVRYGEGVYRTGLTMGKLARVFRNNHPGNEATWVAQGPDRQLLHVISVDPLTEERRRMVFLFDVGPERAIVQRLAVGLHEASEREIYVTMMEIAATVAARERGPSRRE
jgi:hypothetical protein